MAGAGVIEDYVADLDGRLRGQKRAKLDLLTEARDSLEDAAECYRGAGFCAEDAERRAVDDFGPVPAIARDYQAELAVAYGARTLRSILFVLPVASLLWEVTRLIWYGSWENFPGVAPPQWYYIFTQLNDTMAWAVAISCALALLISRLWSRRTGDTRMVARCVAGVALAATISAMFAMSALFIATAAFDVGRMFVSPPMALASFVAFGVMVRLTVMARRTVSFCV
jgi:hypothetical protein